MKLIISIVVLVLTIILLSCSVENNKEIVKRLIKQKDNNINESSKKPIIEEDSKKLIKDQLIEINKNIPIYFIGEPYFIAGVKHIPKEDYSYNETGLSSYYGPKLHRKRTSNNEYNKVTELLARHKTLPLPSVVKITNLENGLSINVRVNDRGPLDNSKIIEVSRKVAQLLRFYKSKIARVRVEIMSDPSKQLKIVTQSMSDPEFDKTLKAVPTEDVTITNLDSTEEETSLNENYEQPIEIGFEDVSKTNLYIKISGFNSYQDIQKVKNLLKETYKNTTQKEIEGYSIIFGPMLNQDADNLFQILVSRGYKQSEIIIK